MNATKCSLLIVDDEPYILSTLAGLLRDEYEVVTAESAEAAQRIFAARPIDLLLTDQKMPRMSGVQLLEWVRQHRPRTVRLMMTGFADLEEAVDAINKGQVFRYLFKPWRFEELREVLHSAARSFTLERDNVELLHELRSLNDKLVAANAALETRVAARTRELQDAYAELEQKNKMLEKLALTDPLTGLPNRRAMDRLAERELRRRDRFPRSLTIAMIDVDHFKSINDRYLLPGGDQVLIDLAKVLTSTLRDVDFLGRIGGEEFMLVAPETDMAGAEVLGDRIRGTVENALFEYKNAVIPVRVSIGFAVVEANALADYESIKHLAAAALSAAKSSGRNRCVYYAMPAVVEQVG